MTKDWSNRFTSNFKLSQEAQWFEFCPNVPVALETIEFEMPVMLHGYANGTTVAKVEAPIKVQRLKKDVFWFGNPVHPPHGIVSLRLSMPLGESESDVEVVFRSLGSHEESRMFPDDLISVESSPVRLRNALERLRHRYAILEGALTRIGDHASCNADTAGEMIATARAAIKAEKILPRGE